MSAAEALHPRVTLGPLAAIPLGEGRTFLVDGRRLALFRGRDGALFATQAECPHKGGPLADGIVSGDTVVCPLHAWRINLIGGRIDRPADVTECVQTYPTFVDNGVIVVGLPATLTSKEAGEAA